MADLNLTPTWDAGVYRIETTDPVMGGENGISNKGAKNLGNRTEWLKQQLNINANRILGAGSIMKQAIVTAKHDADGRPAYASYVSGTFPNQFTLHASAEEPFVVSFSAGYDANGPAVYFGIFTEDQNMSIGNNDPQNVYVEYNVSTGVMTTGTSPQETVYASYFEPSTPSLNQYWYNMRNEKMYVYNGLNEWQHVIRVIICSITAQGGGEATYPKNIGIGTKDLYGKNVIPAGTVTAFAGVAARVPPGWLLCNGSAVSRSVYRDLYEAILGNYGNGDGTTTFNIPDLRGEFIRGLDNGRGIDTGRIIGSAQAGSIQSHSHSSDGSGFIVSDSAGSSSLGTGGSAVKVSAFTGLYGGSETRPRNIAMNYIIKF